MPTVQGHPFLLQPALKISWTTRPASEMDTLQPAPCVVGPFTAIIAEEALIVTCEGDSTRLQLQIAKADPGWIIYTNSAQSPRFRSSGPITLLMSFGKPNDRQTTCLICVCPQGNDRFLISTL
jgi:hypothetical protein